MSAIRKPLNQSIDLKLQELQILSELKKLFGSIPYVAGNTYTGFIFTEQSFPELHPVGSGQYQAWITKDCRNRRLKGTWQLAHELGHLIAPATMDLDTYFEEGLVVSLQLRYMERFKLWKEGREYVESSLKQLREGDTAKYGRALDDVRELERQSGKEIFNIAKDLVDQHSLKSFGLLTLDQLASTTGSNDKDLLGRLLERFPAFTAPEQPLSDSISSSGA